MLESLRARLIVSFAVVVALAVFLAGAGALFLLRDEQQDVARERYGRYAEPLNHEIVALQKGNESLIDLSAEMRKRANELGARVILLDQDLQVVFDSDDGLQGKYVLSFENKNLKLIESNGARYKWTNYRAGGNDLLLFAPPPRDPDPVSESGFVAQPYDALIAIPANQLGSAWLDLAPRLALAGAIALTVSFIVSYFISRSISRPLARITQASVQMASGNYDVHIPIRGEDEVGRLSEAFNVMAREVSTSQRTMKDLLANVSHELKTPLTSIQGFSQAMIDGAVKSQPELEDSVRIINHEANRMRGLVDDLLLLSQIESGQLSMEQTQVDLAPLLERTLERFQWVLRDGGVEWKLDVAPMPPVFADERRLEQVFSNLIDNAVRHTPRSGMITVSGAAVPGGPVNIRIHNTGSVIPVDDLSRVFERFFQVDRARARKGGSSGLGLSIVSEIVDAHRGRVRAESAEGQGTTFIVSLPPSSAATVNDGRISVHDEHGRAPKRRRSGASPRPSATPGGGVG